MQVSHTLLRLHIFKELLLESRSYSHVNLHALLHWCGGGGSRRLLLLVLRSEPATACHHLRREVRLDGASRVLMLVCHVREDGLSK